MNFKIVICLLLGVYIGECIGEKERIFGGENANIQDYPYQISMRWTYGGPRPMHFCGGSIVSKNHIVTAAHCVDDKRTPNMMNYIRIYTGTSRSDSVGEGKSYSVKSMAIHPNYRGASTVYENDIAIITLQEPIEFNEFQQPIKLPTHDVTNGAKAIITGWGNTDRQSQRTPIYLQKADMRLINSEQCKRQLPYPLKNSQVCALQTYGVGVCSGDSGGPLAVNGELVGIASYVVECGKGHPDVYTNVYSFVNYIKQTINSGRCSD